MTPLAVSAEEVRAAHGRLFPYLLPTPLLESSWLSERAGRTVLVKWESRQRTGSFKWRGALHKLLCLRERGVERVLAVSAGNHGLGVAEAARLLGMKATIVVPECAVATKVEAIARAGVELVRRGADYDAAEAYARALAEELGVDFVSPYNDAEVIAGQGTVALEMLGQGRFSSLIVPTGGGGLIAGCALVTADSPAPPRVIGAQPIHAPAMHDALARGGEIGPIHEEPTLADGLSGNLESGSITVPIVARLVSRVVLVSEQAIAAAMRAFAERDHEVVEGSAAVGAAAVIEGRLGASLVGDGPMAVIVSGRNLDLSRLREVIA